MLTTNTHNLDRERRNATQQVRVDCGLHPRARRRTNRIMGAVMSTVVIFTILPRLLRSPTLATNPTDEPAREEDPS